MTHWLANKILENNLDEEKDEPVPIIMNNNDQILLAVITRNVNSTTKRLINFGQKYKCNWCETTLPPTHHFDHVNPIWNCVDQKSANHTDNIQSLCPNCHNLKTLIERLIKHNNYNNEDIHNVIKTYCTNMNQIQKKFILYQLTFRKKFPPPLI